MTDFALGLAVCLVMCMAFGGILRATVPGLVLAGARRDLAAGPDEIRRQGFRVTAACAAILLAMSIVVALLRGA